MRSLDAQEQKIIKALIKNPRMSDNQIGKLTRVPIRTVSRKRKRLEEEGLISYFTKLDMGYSGTGRFGAKHLYIIKFNMGITREQYLEEFKKESHEKSIFTEFVYESHIGEVDGHLALIMIIEGKNDLEITENFNKIILPSIRKNHGQDSVVKINTLRLDMPVRILHNYLPFINMEKGKLKEEWLDNSIFVG